MAAVNEKKRGGIAPAAPDFVSLVQALRRPLPSLKA
jgi:hypothetical protein